MEMKVGSKLRRIREAKGIPMKDMADRLEMSHAGYSKIERDEVGVNIDKLEKIANELNVTPEDILAFDDKNVFNNSTLQSCAFNYGQVNNHFPEKLQQLYEDKIKLLEDKILFMQKEINRLNA